MCTPSHKNPTSNTRNSCLTETLGGRKYPKDPRAPVLGEAVSCDNGSTRELCEQYPTELEDAEMRAIAAQVRARLESR